MTRFRASFFARPVLSVAPELLGCLLIHQLDSGARRVGRVVEVEAYLGDGTDPASHAHRGPTRRNREMFGRPGRFYVYRSMGLHVCANVVCEPQGRAAAVLLRALEPLEGIEDMRRARGGQSDRELSNGPGKLCQALGIGLDHDGHSALSGALRLEPADRPIAQRIMRGPRIGLSRARELRYRFFAEGSEFVTRSKLNTAARVYRRSGLAQPILRSLARPGPSTGRTAET